MTSTGAVELYWMPGCTSCVRMKEFVEKSGKPFEAINFDVEVARGEKLRQLGLMFPVLHR